MTPGVIFSGALGRGRVQGGGCVLLGLVEGIYISGLAGLAKKQESVGVGKGLGIQTYQVDKQHELSEET